MLTLRGAARGWKWCTALLHRTFICPNLFIFQIYINMGEVTSLRNENAELKKQLQEIQKDLSSVTKKVAAPSRKQQGAEWQNLQTPLVIA